MNDCCCNIELIVDEGDQITLEVSDDSQVALDIQEQFIGGGEITPTGTKTIEVDENGTVTEDVTYYASVKVETDVPNTYTAADEDKVVQDGSLEAQTTATFSANDVYDTTTIKQVTVSVPASAVDSGYVYINENGTEDVTGYAQALVAVPNTYTAGDEGKVVDDGELVVQTSEEYTANGTYDTTTISEVTVSVSGGEPTGTKEISITANGTTTENVGAYAYAEITANVPNTYAAGDEGKVVSSGALVSQTTRNVSANGTYDTTTNNSTVVAVPASAVDSGTKSIATNGTHDVVGYASVTVAVPTEVVTVSDTTDTAGGTIRTITAETVTKQTLTVSSPGTYTAPAGVVYTQVIVS